MLRPFLTRALAPFLVFYTVLVGGMFGVQRYLLFPARAPRDLPATVTRLDAPIAGGSVPILWLPTPDGPVVAWFHGNGEQLADVVPVAERLHRRGVAFAGVEYPGYGLSEGPGPTEARLFEAARSALGVLAGRHEGPVTCVGHSLGTGVAAAMAAEGRCAGLVLISPFTSIRAVAQQRYPFLPVGLLLLDPFDSAARAPSIRVPTLVTHGSEDPIVPVEMGRELAGRIAGAVYVERDRGHMNILDDATFDRVAAFARSPTRTPGSP